MKTDNALRQELPKVMLCAALSLFRIPALTFGFVRYANREAVCDTYGEAWQRHQVMRRSS
jgi:hypothetical protein